MKTTINAKAIFRKTAKKIGHGAHILVPKKYINKELVVIEERH